MPSPSPEPRSWSRITTVLFITLLALTASLRWWGISFGSPAAQCRPDEELILREALFRLEGDPHFHMHFYPPGHMLLESFWIRGAQFLGVLPEPALSAYAREPMPFHMAVRHLGAITSVLTALLVFFLLRRLAVSDLAAFFGAAFLAAAPLANLSGHFASLDSPGSFIFLAALATVFWTTPRLTTPRLMIGAFLAGCAFGFKYPHGAAFAGIWGVTLQTRRFKAAFLLLPAALIAGILTAAPTFILQFSDACAGLMGQVGEQTHIGAGWNFESKWWYNLKTTLGGGMGLAPLGLALIGVLLIAKQAPRLLYLFSPGLVLYVVHSTGIIFPRYLLPVVSLLVIAAAFTIEAVRRRFGAPAAIALALLALFLPLRDCIDYNIRLARPDTRAQLLESFIDQKLPSHLPIVAPHFLVTPFPESWQAGKLAIYSGLESLHGCRERAAITRRAVADLKSLTSENWPPKVYLVNRENYLKVLSDFRGQDVLIIVMRSFCNAYSWFESIWADFDVAALEARGEARRLLILDPLEGKPFPDIRLYDRLDYWYLSFPNPRLVDRPGPKIEVWQISIR